MVKLIDMINQKLELYRLEKRYINSRNRRSTFVSDAVYVDGEYYSANNTYSANCTAGDGDSGSNSSSSKESKVSKDTTGKTMASTRSKRSSLMDWRRGSVRGKHGDREGTKVSVRELNWDGSVRS
ncbi:hypothetical protein BCIN_15g00840 [Botrytis cinerea B05.10]|uniref:Uncharacterized protein n=2 Tax=Botryotinia fuckeliana TaxID=40559 RepID=A0A384K3U8_BOTFB|nr:hypothetical protein BCIN_15g00840 [Botrytis cinerea B05.10]ATZ57509.1 hypothetical protein BCIN_15g00840 [Botrytis cinerea B05.10]CCD47548.1 hypothetical protein BofuT4_P007070.1 [Botrytis cinerea T4]